MNFSTYKKGQEYDYVPTLPSYIDFNSDMAAKVHRIGDERIKLGDGNNLGGTDQSRYLRRTNKMPDPFEMDAFNGRNNFGG